MSERHEIEAALAAAVQALERAAGQAEQRLQWMARSQRQGDWRHASRLRRQIEELADPAGVPSALALLVASVASEGAEAGVRAGQAWERLQRAQEAAEVLVGDPEPPPDPTTPSA